MTDLTSTAPLRAWLDERRAEIEHDHQDSWTGRPDQCYCDLTKPCADRARELEAVDGLCAVLDEREQMRARLDGFGDVREGWGVRWPGYEATCNVGEEKARQYARDDLAATLRMRLVGEWRDADDIAQPPTPNGA
jgi:hypothetical protein